MRNEKQVTLFHQFTKVFGSDEGQIVLDHIKEMCRYEQSELNHFTADGKIDPYWMAASCGKRSAYIDILDCMKEPPIIPDEPALNEWGETIREGEE